MPLTNYTVFTLLWKRKCFKKARGVFAQVFSWSFSPLPFPLSFYSSEELPCLYQHWLLDIRIEITPFLYYGSGTQLIDAEDHMTIPILMTRTFLASLLSTGLLGSRQTELNIFYLLLPENAFKD